LAGRRSDQINVRGLKVNPEEVEEALNAHPAIVESACDGVPDPSGITGECVRAVVVARSVVTSQELVEWLRGRLEEYKIPRLWEQRASLPKTASGKIQRHRLPEEASDGP